MHFVVEEDEDSARTGVGCHDGFLMRMEEATVTWRRGVWCCDVDWHCWPTLRPAMALHGMNKCAIMATKVRAQCWRCVLINLVRRIPLPSHFTGEMLQSSSTCGNVALQDLQCFQLR